MAHINLLPWRANLRKKRQRAFGVAAGSAVLITALLLVLSHMHIEGMIQNQKRRNDFLKQEIASVEEKIKEIKELEKTKARLLARMEVIQELQSSRPQIVHLFDELVDTIPEGAFLVDVQQGGNVLDLEGRAQSNARVSAYMRNIDGSGWLGNANLKVIESKDQTGTGLSHFRMSAQQINKSKGAEQ